MSVECTGVNPVDAEVVLLVARETAMIDKNEKSTYLQHVMH